MTKKDELIAEMRKQTEYLRLIAEGIAVLPSTPASVLRDVKRIDPQVADARNAR